jgi:hypothetical protein
MRRFCRAGSVVTFAGLASACAPVRQSQGPVPAAGAGGPDVAGVVALLNRFDTHWLVPGTDTMIMSRAGVVQPVASHAMLGGEPIGMTIEAVRRASGAHGRPVLDVAFEERDSIGVVTRTVTRVDAESLLPLGQRADLGDGHVVTLVYLTDHLVGIDSVPGRPVDYFSTTVPDTAYTSGSIDLLLRALPLADGFRTSLPLYYPADNIVQTLPVRVAGHEHITTRAGRGADCWLVAADFPGGITEHFWIEESSHTILRILAHDGETSLVRYDR